jgi:hypothetical protein
MPIAIRDSQRVSTLGRRYQVACQAKQDVAVSLDKAPRINMIASAGHCWSKHLVHPRGDPPGELLSDVSSELKGKPTGQSRGDLPTELWTQTPT